ARHLRFTIETDTHLPQSLETDIQRLNQILKNLLSNSLKITEKGEVRMHMYEAKNNWRSDLQSLSNAKQVVAFAISDTGIGIPQEKQNIIFEAFQQAEGSTSRKYGGTGLGLSISRGLAEMLGGTIELESNPQQGSTFILYLPTENMTSLTPLENGVDNFSIQSSLMIPQNINLENSIQLVSDGMENRGLDIINEMINDAGDDRNNIQP